MHRKALIIGLSIGFAGCLLLATAPARAQGDFIRGDANGNGVVNGSDTTKIIFHILMGSSVPCRDAVDVNDDGRIDITDLVALADFLWNTGPPPPPPYPDCGTDPTPDDIECGSSTCTPAWTCPIIMTGDCNMDGVINSTDIIGMVNFAFKSGEAPLPCMASADVNCNGQVTSVDIIGTVNYVFKSGEPPCDVCGIMPDQWGEMCP